MRSLALALALGALVLALAALAQAQPPAYGSRELVVAGRVPILLDTIWTAGRSGRTARVVASLDDQERTLYAGATVRTAAAARPDALAVVAFHGGEAPFVRVLVSPVGGGGLGEPVSVELDRSAARGRSETLRPAAALVTSTRDGFAILVQEQEADPTADVVTTLTRIDRAGAVVEPTHVVAIPWQLAALVARDEGGYELGVVYGAGSTPEAPRARACVVALGPTGEPTEHPWWASGDDAYAEVALALDAGALVVAWRAADGTTVASTRWTADGRWSVPPSAEAISSLGTIAPDAAFALVVRDGAVAIVTR